MTNILTKLFADDTTLVFASEHLDELISKCKHGIRTLFEWCSYNYLYVNWSKTCAMYITSKRSSHLPKFIKIENLKIEVVHKFKLLGVTLDSKLNFTEHVTTVSKSINSKLFAIKRLFYLSFNVKLQFFKSFILPYFDYCLSLVLYYSKLAINKLARIYYFCLINFLTIIYRSFLCLY